MWIIVTLVASCLQIARTSEQHRIRSLLNTSEAGYVRFVYAFPIALLASTIWFGSSGSVPTPGTRFWVGIVGGGTAQILATMALLKSYKLRDFAIGTVYTKTEVLFVGASSAVVLGEPLSKLAWVGAIICLIGVAWLAASGIDPEQNITRVDPAAMFGVAAACGFAMAAIGIRAASTSLTGTVAERALLTLTLMLGIQAAIQGLAIALSRESSLRNVLRAWRPALLIACLSLSGSFAWAVAMTLENAAKVRTLGQIEIVLAFAISIVVHRHQHRRAEYVASAVAASGIFLLVVS